jgi:hypothetical protein
MKDVIFLIFHLLTTLAKLLQPGGSRAIIAEKMRPQPDALDDPTPAIYPKALQNNTGVESPGSSGITRVSSPPGYYPRKAMILK